MGTTPFLQAVGRPTVELLQLGVGTNWSLAPINTPLINRLIELSVDCCFGDMLNPIIRRDFFDQWIASAPSSGVAVFRRSGEEQISGFTIFSAQPPKGLRKNLVLELVKLFMPNLVPDSRGDRLIFAYQQILWSLLNNRLLAESGEFDLNVWFDTPDYSGIESLLAQIFPHGCRCGFRQHPEWGNQFMWLVRDSVTVALTNR